MLTSDEWDRVEREARVSETQGEFGGDFMTGSVAIAVTREDEDEHGASLKLEGTS